MTSLDQELVRLIREIVKQELSQKRIKTSELNSGGDVTIASMGNIHIRPGVNGIAEYNGRELNTGLATNGNGTTNKLAKFTGTSTLGNSNVTDDGSNVTSSKPINLSDSNTYTKNNAGDYEIHVASGKKVKIIVG